MNPEALQRAKDGLQIQDVFMATSSSSLVGGFDPKFDPRLASLELELRHIPKRSYLIDGVHNGEQVSIFRVEIELGARQLAPFDGQESDEAQPDVLVKIEATFMADYHIINPLLKDDREALDTFAVANASYHVWPYWREYLSSQATRMNLPKITLPMMQFSQAKK
jgi:hypothetical protein